jgi:hypothetical protein
MHASYRHWAQVTAYWVRVVLFHVQITKKFLSLCQIAIVCHHKVCQSGLIIATVDAKRQHGNDHTEVADFDTHPTPSLLLERIEGALFSGVATT